MEKQGVPMNQYPQAADALSPQPTGQPPMYSDPNQEHAQYHQPQQDTYAQPQQQQYTGTPAHPQETYKGDGQHYPPQQQQHQQQPGMPPQQASGMVYQNATPIASLNRSPAPVDCPACGQRALTNCSFKTGNTNHAWAAGACFFLCLGCIPYMMNSLKDVQHKCGRCGVLLATYHRSGNTEVHIHS